MADGGADAVGVVVAFLAVADVAVLVAVADLRVLVVQAVEIVVVAKLNDVAVVVDVVADAGQLFGCWEAIQNDVDEKRRAASHLDAGLHIGADHHEIAAGERVAVAVDMRGVVASSDNINAHEIDRAGGGSLPRD
ncbi:MAG: hypothetical protein Q7T33_04260 [Dehalococcoidia bacterium]|nr:hypothetical protein [Dehalococcoidia bacterium]